MNPKSFITLCIVGIVYVIIGATAILSPHDTGLAQSVGEGDEPKPKTTAYITPLTGKTDEISVCGISSDEKVDVEVTLEGMTAFTKSKVTVNIGNKNVTFTAVDFGKTLYKWLGFRNADEIVIVTDTAGNRYNFSLTDLKMSDNAYICYADENLEPLDSTEYGSFCFVVISGDNAGIITGLSRIDLNP